MMWYWFVASKICIKIIIIISQKLWFMMSFLVCLSLWKTETKPKIQILQCLWSQAPLFTKGGEYFLLCSWKQYFNLSLENASLQMPSFALLLIA